MTYFQVMGAVSLQEKSNVRDAHSSDKLKWETIQQRYKRAQEEDAISQINSSASSFTDTPTGLRFVLQIAENLQDKPKQSSGKQKG